MPYSPNFADEHFDALKAEICKLHDNKCSKKDIVLQLFENHKNDTKDEFYPFVTMLFNAMGFNCECSRGGDNASRWDAIIKDERKSIPIEIKSPTEELFISVKAIRQALENKIVLLSRKTHLTDEKTTSMVVGYNIPNDRSEVDALIKAFKRNYNISVSVIGLEILLAIIVNMVLENKSIANEELFSLEGIVYADI